MADLKLRKGGIRNSHISSTEMRRPLKTPILTPPDFNIEPERLQNDYVEYETLYLGCIPDVPMEVDITNRTEVLRFIDRGQKKNFLKNELEVIFSICKQNIRISRRDGSEEPLLRVPINEIAAICYIKDDGIHILAAKHGTQENCSLAVLHCKSQDIAEAICALVAQCFHLVYTDVMIDLIERTIDIANREASGSLSSSDAVKQALRRGNTVPAVIPGGCSSKLQPLDFSANKPVKFDMRKSWTNFIRKAAEGLSKENDNMSRIKSAGKQTVVDWIVKAVESLQSKPDLIRKSSKVCGISNNLNGCEDNIIRDPECDGSDSEEDEFDGFEPEEVEWAIKNVDRLKNFN